MSTNENEPDVKITERVEVTPAGDDDTVESPDSSQEESTEEGADEKKEPESEETEEEADKADTEETKPEQTDAAPDTTTDDEDGDIKPIPGESKREFALRLENKRLRTDLRKGRTSELVPPAPSAPAKKELSPEKQAVLKKFKPEDMQAFREVLDVAAEEMGFVRKDQLGASTYQEKATEELDGFLEKHPEYLPQNDPGNVLWNRFKEEYALYRPPTNPKDLKKVLEKVHKEVFGIKPAAAIDRKDAAKKDVKVASHSGSSRPSPSREGVKRAGTPAAQGLRTDMLKGFSDEEIAELTASS